MLAVLIIICIVIVGAIIYFSVRFHNEKILRIQKQYVQMHSTKLKAIKDINSKYKFYNPSNRDLRYEISLNSKKAFDNFDIESAIRSTFFKHCLPIKSLMMRVTMDREQFALYKKEISKVPSTDFKALPTIKYMNKSIFEYLEKEYIKNEIIKINTFASVTIHWYYCSPAGYNYYERERKFDYNTIVKLYFNYFNEDLSKIERDEKPENTASNVEIELTKIVYSIDEVIDLYSKNGININESFALSALIAAGYLKVKDSNYYVRSSIKNFKDLILATADKDGLITYDNKLKDDEYDKAINKLEKGGRIIPIDNLHFLKVSRDLDYRGITLSEISNFDNLLMKFVKQEKFVSIKQIRDNIDCLLTKIDFDECFLLTIVKYCGFLYQVPGIDKLFTTIKKPERIMFLEWLLKDEKSVDAYDLVYDLKELYDVEYNISSILYDLSKSDTDLYYNSEMEKIYSNKEYFFEEVEEYL